MQTAPIPMFRNKVLNDPRGELRPSEIANLRTLEQFGGATKVTNGWRCGGDFYRYRTLRRLGDLGLADETFDGGRKRLVLNAAGRTVLALLKPGSGDLFSHRTAG